MEEDDWRAVTGDFEVEHGGDVSLSSRRSALVSPGRDQGLRRGRRNGETVTLRGVIKHRRRTMSVTTEEGAGPTAIRSFHVDIAEDALDDLRNRIKATNWPEKETVSDHSQGVPLAMIQDLAGYWATEYDWRKCEAALNALPQFITEIDGLDIHFIHV